MYALIVRFQVRPEFLAAFDEAAAVVSAAVMSSEEGAHVYASFASADDPQQRTFIEVYRDESAFRDHCERPHTRLFLDSKGPWISAESVEFLDGVSGPLVRE